MKKQIQIRTSVFLSVLFFFVTTVFAQVSNTGGDGGGGLISVVQLPELPIESPAVLAAYAKSRIGRVSVSVWAQTLVFNRGSTKTYAEVPYARPENGDVDMAEVLELVSVQKMAFELANPKEWVNANVRFTTDNGSPLFSGGQSFKLVKTGNGWALPASPLKVEIGLDGDVAIPIPDINWATLYLFNDEGQTVEQRNIQVNQQTDELLFPAYLAGQRGQLFVQTYHEGDQDSKMIVFDLATGNQVQAIPVAFTIAATVRDMIIIPAGQIQIIVNPKATNLDARINPLVQITVTPEQVLSRVQVYGEIPNQETAKGFFFKRSGVDEVWTYALIEKGFFTEVQLTAGVYDLIFIWPSFGQVEQFNYGGKAIPVEER